MIVCAQQELRLGCLVEVRVRVGPELHEICPQFAKQFEQAMVHHHLPSVRSLLILASSLFQLVS